MSIDNEKVIDILVPGIKPNEVTLVITDHLPWRKDEADYDHVVKLQNKLNHYLAFIKDGQLEEEYPEHKGKLPIIHVEGKYPLNEKAKEFYTRVGQIAGHDGVLLKFVHSPEKPEREMVNP